jgi:hypothetical protein
MTCTQRAMELLLKFCKAWQQQHVEVRPWRATDCLACIGEESSPHGSCPVSISHSKIPNEKTSICNAQNRSCIGSQRYVQGHVNGRQYSAPSSASPNLLPTFSEILLPSNISGACRPISSQSNLKARIAEGPTDKVGVEQ